MPKPKEGYHTNPMPGETRIRPASIPQLLARLRISLADAEEQARLAEQEYIRKKEIYGQYMERGKYLVGNPNWETPAPFFALLNSKYHFTVDAAASSTNHLLPRYWTKEDSGLIHSWAGESVFCNPPYDLNLYKWVRKASIREAEVAVLVLPPSVDTAWFHDFVWDLGTHQARPGVSVQFLRGRLKFNFHGVPGLSPRLGTMLAIFEY